MDRKYSQKGYQDDSRRDEQPKPAAPKDREGPRSPKMMAFQGVMRCAMCGAIVEADLGEIGVAETCRKCGADIRTCRNCTHFDPGARWECRSTIEVRVGNKTVRTECGHFSPRRTVEKKTGETRSTKSDDPKAAFDRLFKK